MRRGLFARRAVAAALAAAAAAALAVALYRDGRWGFNRPAADRYPVRGLDVSHHQGTIDWPRVRRAGYSFAFIKASEGGDHRDRLFEKHREAASRAGLRVGAYHFFTFCRDGAAQAENLLAALGSAGAGDLPAAVDLEFKGNCSRRPGVAELQTEVRRFADAVERRLGRPVVYYVTPGFMREYAQALPPDAALWVRSVFREPDRSFGRPWTFWQFADNARVPGVAGPVDADAFHGGAEAWADFLERRAAGAESKMLR